MKDQSYVVYVCLQLKDGEQEIAKICSSIKDAADILNGYANSTDRTAHVRTYQVFELGKEIQFIRGIIEEPQPPKSKWSYVVKKEEHR